LLAIFLLFVLLIGGCSVFVWRTISGATDAGNEFVEQLYADPSRAAQDLCAGSATTAAELGSIRDQLVADGWTGGKSLIGAGINSNGNGTEGGVTGSLSTTLSTPVAIELRKPGGDWCVQRLIVGPGAESFEVIS
jgi:hypothetical protein